MNTPITAKLVPPRRSGLVCLLLLGWLIATPLMAADVTVFSVLAKRGEAITRAEWQPTVDYLNQQLPGNRFSFRPLAFHDIEDALRRREVDFVLTNPAQYVQLGHRFGVLRIATLKNRYEDGHLNHFGGVVFTRQDGWRPTSLAQLRGRQLAAVDPISMGGYLMAARELHRLDIHPQDLAELRFLGTHDAVVQAVIDGKIEAGTVRTDTLERMAAEGRLDLDRIHVIPHANHNRDDMPYLHSTDVYAEWPLAAAPHTPVPLVERVAAALISMPSNAPAARASHSRGWTVPANYSDVAGLLRDLQLPPFAPKPRGLIELVRDHPLMSAGISVLLLLLASVSTLLARSNRRLQQASTEQIQARRQLQQQLQLSEDSDSRLRGITGATQDGIVLLDGDGRVVFWNPAVEAMFRTTPGELEGARFHDLFVAENLSAAAKKGLRQFSLTGQGPVVGRLQEMEAHRSDGSVFPVELTVNGLRQHGSWHAVGVIRDITDRRQMKQTLRETRANFANMVEKNRTGILILNEEGVVRFSNPAAQTSLGRSDQELNALFFGVPITASISEMAIRRPDGRVGVAEVSSSQTEWEGQSAYLVMLHDITDRKNAEENARYIAFHDNLTGLPNRALFMDRLNSAIARARRAGHAVGVLFMDLDRFKSVNDTLGHSVGDELLRGFSLRLRDNVRESDTIARLGGDEFVVLIEQLQSAEQAKLVADKVVQACNQPLHLFDHELYARPSVGISVYPDHAEEADALLRQADAAMYAAKRAPGRSISFYEVNMDAELANRLELETELHRALERDDFELHFQPQVALTNGRLVGMEALIRWNHPSRGLVPPGEFISVLEEIELIGEVGDWVIRESCRRLRDWRDQGIAMPPLSVNVSAQQISSGDVVGSILRAAHDHDVPCEALVVEVTESIVMRDLQQSRSVLEELKRHGVGLHLDDFGTGYSSLKVLKNLPFDTLKIDAGFTANIVQNPKDASLTRAIISMARSLGLQTIAEGVETEQQRDFLAGNRCDTGQGFLFSRPCPAAELPGRLREIGAIT